MLSLVMFSYNAGPNLDRVLRNLQDVLHTPQLELILIDLGSTDDTLPSLDAFAGQNNLSLIKLDHPALNGTARMDLARAQATHPYVMQIAPDDHIDGPAVSSLTFYLEEIRPDVVVLGQGFWLGDTEIIGPAPDADRAAVLGGTPRAASLQDLTPDPYRVLVHAHLGTDIKAGSSIAETVHIWDQWRTLINNTYSLGFFAPVVKYTRFQEATALPAMAAAIQNQTDQNLIWTNDALWSTPLKEAATLLKSAQKLALHLTAKQRANAPNPLGQILQALAADEMALAMSHLTMHLAQNDRMWRENLTAGVTKLRADLDIALPAPDYLRDLYNRIRSQ